MDRPFQYNDTYARIALNGSSAPPRQLSLVYQVGYYCLPPEYILPLLAQVNATSDVVVANLGPHCVTEAGLEDWKQRVDALAAMLAGMQSRVVWRTSYPVKDEAERDGLPDTSSYNVHRLFQVCCRP